ncbi:MAG: hypothetical protein GC131_03840 [Alphaproteobacteria bacterium]|nr:hypothetical protein [Alphaproteobacteria bacterium]
MVKSATAFCTILAGVILLAGPAAAGSMNYANGQGVWQSSNCRKPGTAAGIGGPAEIPANDLNAQIIHHNAAVAEMADYMRCLSDEASNDARAAAEIITNAAAQEIQKTQSAMSLKAQQLKQESE